MLKAKDGVLQASKPAMGVLHPKKLLVTGINARVRKTLNPVMDAPKNLLGAQREALPQKHKNLHEKTLGKPLEQIQ